MLRVSFFFSSKIHATLNEECGFKWNIKAKNQTCATPFKDEWHIRFFSCICCSIHFIFITELFTTPNHFVIMQFFCTSQLLYIKNDAFDSSGTIKFLTITFKFAWMKKQQQRNILHFDIETQIWNEHFRLNESSWLAVKIKQTNLLRGSVLRSNKKLSQLVLERDARSTCFYFALRIKRTPLRTGYAYQHKLMQIGLWPIDIYKP